MTVLEAATCPFCGLHCGDLRLELDSGRLAGCTPACARASAGYRKALRGLRPSADPDEALQAARTWFEAARRPLVLLADDADNKAVHSAIRLARRRGALLVLDDGGESSALALAMKSAGLLSGTLGELRHGAARLLLCGPDPAREMPRFWGFLPPGQKAAALRLKNAGPLEAVRQLRLARRAGAGAGGSMKRLAAVLAATPSGAVLFGKDWLQAGVPGLTELLLWLQELNASARWYGLPLLSGPNRFGLAEALLSETGYPGSLRFVGGKAEYVPYELRLATLLTRRQVDLLVVVGTPQGPDLAGMTGALKSIQISAEPPVGRRGLWLPSARPGVDAAGEMLRLDGVPARLGALFPGGRPAAAEIVDWLCAEVPA